MVVNRACSPRISILMNVGGRVRTAITRGDVHELVDRKTALRSASSPVSRPDPAFPAPNRAGPTWPARVLEEVVQRAITAALNADGVARVIRRAVDPQRLDVTGRILRDRLERQSFALPNLQHTVANRNLLSQRDCALADHYAPSGVSST